MVGARAGKPVDTSTFHGRLRAARLASPYDAQQLAEAIGRASQQSIYDYENPEASGSPSPEALGILAKMTGRTLNWLVYGEEEEREESDFIVSMRAAESRLDDRGKRSVVAAAEHEVEEAQKRVHDVASANAMAERLMAEGFGRNQAIRAVLSVTGIAPSLAPDPADDAASQGNQQAL